MSQLQRYLQAACSPENFEPNLALNLEIVDLINSKKGNAPREAATTIVSYINHRNPTVALLALHLLDICVKNCGYAFHLQISTKEFLNELVRRFPERPPIRCSKVQTKILACIEEWRGTICETSRYKQDLGFIRDMHRLLSYKGYSFPEVRREDAAVLNPSDNLKSAEEMEEEEREAQSAKLQELIRRGTPADLQEANRLMKVMTGFDTRSKTDYRAKAAEEVGKIQAKARLLEERLEAFQPGDKMVDGDVFSELAAALQSAQPKIQKMCEEESEDHEAVAKLFEINDNIHRTVERYKLMKKGDIEGAKSIAGGQHTKSKEAAQLSANTSASAELSLIDFGGDPESTAGSSTPSSSQKPSSSAGLENDLLGLAIGESSSTSASFGQGGGIALGFGANSNVPGPSLLSSMTHNSTARTASPLANFSPSPGLSQAQTPQPAASNDPFAALAGLSSSSSPAPAASFGASSVKNTLTSTSTPATASTTVPAEDDEWAFSSALPEVSSAPKEIRSTVNNTSIKIDMVAGRRPTSANAIAVAFFFSNNTPQPVGQLHFQLAVTKGFELGLQPQTGRDLAPHQNNGVTQAVEVWKAGDKASKVDSVKLRWRISYSVSGSPKPILDEVAVTGSMTPVVIATAIADPSNLIATDTILANDVTIVNVTPATKTQEPMDLLCGDRALVRHIRTVTDTENATMQNARAIKLGEKKDTPKIATAAQKQTEKMNEAQIVEAALYPNDIGGRAVLRLHVPAPRGLKGQSLEAQHRPIAQHCLPKSHHGR
ncbi:putative ADP-ribosylation factor-binding protein C25H2.16c [Ceratocystis platani]|uniref:Putative ADP-ribosylation factor-binding protein C25H2.16c n=1 Tax=Ceratocystis fimbriata f. sp. platani TaxID=88771 RepID=A0A0F8DDV5_CERFI|nr:putative ADP-ribosylation factor-binding protein C25H2.16c [Ceratocystis platani]